MTLLSIARDLTRRKARERRRLFVAEGVRCVEELVRSNLELRGVLIAPDLIHTPRALELVELLKRRTSVQETSGTEFSSAAETDSPQGILAIAAVPERRLDDLSLSVPFRLLILDGIQDPGNVGTMLRSASALGAAGTVALEGTVDLWNAKVVRSAMGAHFTHPAFLSTWNELDSFRARERVELWGADVAGTPIGALEAPERLGVVLGNEGVGLSGEAGARVERMVSIPVSGGIESLNVAVAAGILLYELNRRPAA